MIEPVVDAAIRSRPRYPYEWAGPWRASVCGANRYDGAGSSVGWHADQLTCMWRSLSNRSKQARVIGSSFDLSDSV